MVRTVRTPLLALLLLLLLALSQTATAQQVGSAASDKQTLLAFAAATHPTSLFMTTWDAVTGLAAWRGVQCDATERVVVLNLAAPEGCEARIGCEDVTEPAWWTEARQSHPLASFPISGDVALLAPLTALRYLSLGLEFDNTGVVVSGDIAGLTPLVELRFLDVRRSLVHGEPASLIGLTHLGESLTLPDGTTAKGGVHLAETNVGGSVAGLRESMRLAALTQTQTQTQDAGSSFVLEFSPCTSLGFAVTDGGQVVEEDDACGARGLGLAADAMDIAGMDECACCVNPKQQLDVATGQCGRCEVSEVYDYGSCVTCFEPARCAGTNVCLGHSVEPARGCPFCEAGYYGIGSSCYECPPSQMANDWFIAQITVALAACVVISKVIWVVSAKRDGAEDTGTVSDAGIVISIALPSLVNISFTFTLPAFPFPEFLRRLGGWIALVSFDVGSVGAPECLSMAGLDTGAGSDWLPQARFLITQGVFIALCMAFVLSGRVAERPAHSRNAITAAYTLALPALTRGWVKTMDCSYDKKDLFHATLDAAPHVRCGEEGEHWNGTGRFGFGAPFALLWSVVVPVALFIAVRKAAAADSRTPEAVDSHAWLLLKYRRERWWFVSPSHAQATRLHIDMHSVGDTASCSACAKLSARRCLVVRLHTCRNFHSCCPVSSSWLSPSCSTVPQRGTRLPGFCLACSRA
jgi:hypothetical protein